jgi:hypothetical protein
MHDKGVKKVFSEKIKLTPKMLVCGIIRKQWIEAHFWKTFGCPVRYNVVDRFF